MATRRKPLPDHANGAWEDALALLERCRRRLDRVLARPLPVDVEVELALALVDVVRADSALRGVKRRVDDGGGSDDSGAD